MSSECPKCWSKRIWSMWADEKTGRHERYCAKCQHEWTEVIAVNVNIDRS